MSTDHAPAARDCLFCRIVAREIPADIIHETATTLAFRDIEPQAPTHVLVIPKEHQPDVAALGVSSPQGVVELFEAVGSVAAQEGLGAGYRTVFNTGSDRANAASDPPTIKVSVPATAPAMPPETGASTASMPWLRALA